MFLGEHTKGQDCTQKYKNIPQTFSDVFLYHDYMLRFCDERRGEPYGKN